MKDKYHFVAISGSTRRGSYNSLALKAVQKLAPENIVIEFQSITEVPFYSFDSANVHFRNAVEKLNEVIKAADAVILVTPEYSYSVPGMLKNTIDLIARSAGNPFDMKPVGLMGAGPGILDTVKAQHQLREILEAVNACVMNEPEIMVKQPNIKFDESGNLQDEKTAEVIRKFILSLAAFSDRVKEDMEVF